MALVIPAGSRSVEVVMPPQVQVLEQQLRINQQRCEILDSYYHGRHPHTFDSMRFQQAFGRQLRSFADNWMRLVINSTANRLTVQGFQVGSGEDILSADNDAWGIWQANDMDRASMMAHRETMKYGTAFVMVDPTVEPSAITVESPLQVVGQRSAANRFVLVNAIKKWVGDDGFLYLNYYEPARVFKFRSASRAPSPVVVNDGERVTQPATWMPLGEVENPLGVVPIIPFENQPDTLIGGVSDLDDLIPLNDALNKVLRDMLVASEYQNFRQRYIIGAENPKDPVTGQPLSQSQAQLVASMSQFMAFPPTSKEDHPITVGEFGQVDLSPYIESIEMLIHHISMVSMTPAYMLVGKMANLSADAIRAAELGFVGKLETKQTDFGGAWARGMSLALKGKDPAPQVTTLWKTAAANSGSVLSNELVQLNAINVPKAVLWRLYGATPQEIQRWKAMNEAEPPTPAAPQYSPPAPEHTAADD